MLLVDLEDFKKLFQYFINEGKDEMEFFYGLIFMAFVGVIMWCIVELEQQGVDWFFGECFFDVEDFCCIDEEGKGMVFVFCLIDIQDCLKLFFIFMLQILVEIYVIFLEEGDMDWLKFVFFIDEVYLVFEEVLDVFLD